MRFPAKTIFQGAVIGAAIGLTLMAGMEPAVADEVASPVRLEARVTLIDDVRLPARQTGALLLLNVREGQVVKRGEVLGRIDTSLSELEAEVARQQAEMAKAQMENQVNIRYAQKSLQVAQAEFDRLREATRSFPEAVTKAELDEAQFVAERSQMSIEQAEFEMKSAGMTYVLREKEGKLAETRVALAQMISPCEGMVVEIAKRPGEWAEIGEPMLRIIGLKKLRVEAFVDSGRSSMIKLGESVRFESASRRVYSGKIAFVSPEVNPVNGQVRVWADVENTELLLRPGTRGKLILDASKRLAPEVRQTARK
ncbi:MAG: HlyD family efflux transporter periplasmic adaptor subunit [Planctomycetota bacterium]